MTVLSHHTPDQIRPPSARYSHGVSIPSGHRLVFCSGQLGADPKDDVPPGAREQADLCFSNIDAVLRDAGAAPSHVVRINAFVTGREHLAGYMAARDAYFESVEPPPASTLMVVSGFAREAFLVEVEVIAAVPDEEANDVI